MHGRDVQPRRFAFEFRLRLARAQIIKQLGQFHRPCQVRRVPRDRNRALTCGVFASFPQDELATEFARRPRPALLMAQAAEAESEIGFPFIPFRRRLA